MFDTAKNRYIPSTDENLLNKVFSRIMWECIDIGDLQEESEDQYDE